MQLISRTTLIYQAGTSDKIYEIDLCQAGENRYLVNFRYGRRGTTLKEGTKTIQAVPLAEAVRVFDKLVDSKIQKGYRDSQQPISNPSPPAVITATSSDIRHQAILQRLANRNNSKWSLDRVIWRAGELKIWEATPLLISLIGTGEPLRDYCIAWALGWCGDESAIAQLQQLTQDSSKAEFVRRIAWEALYKLSDEQKRAEMRSQKIAQLPAQLHNLAQNGTAEAFKTALQTYLNSSDYKCFAVLDTIYQIDNEYVRPALLDIICDAPLRPNYFQRIRHIFKIAEYRHDAEIFGILAYIFEQEPGKFDNYCIQWDSVSRRYIPIDKNCRCYTEELKSPQSTKYYSKQTREYLRRRVWRTLKQLGEENDSNYINMAVGILLQYSDDDAVEVKNTSFRRWNQQLYTYESFSKNWDRYANYLIFNHILYENSPRYIAHPQAWLCSQSYKPGDSEPNQREEAFPELWQQHPEALLQLLLESNCRPVHHFAVKAMRTCSEFCDRLDINTIIQLLSKPYEVTAKFAFELALPLYNSSQPQVNLVLAVANCELHEARLQAYRWIEAQREYFSSSDFIASLVTSQQAETRTFARRLLSSSILDDATARVLIGRIIAVLLSLTPNQTDMAREVSETLLLSFTPQLRHLGFGVILDLLRHPMPEIQALGARILLNHETQAIDLPADLIESLIASPYESVRGIGMRIFGQLPDEKLLSDRTLILAMAVSATSDIRQAIRPIIRRLANSNLDFAGAIASELINILLAPEKSEGLRKDIVQLLQADIPGWMQNISKATTMQLLRAKFSVVQELGGLVLQANSDRFLSELSISEIVKLANNEILPVREAARQIFLQSLDSIRTNSEEMLSAVRLLESKWDDSREFATKIFSNFTTQDWTPEVIISICDSVREDVRAFGRDLVIRNFADSYGQEYLLKFSEHPSADMQTFATNYLEDYAVDNPERLRKLAPYFISVLCSVNRGRVAKQRIFTFLDAEAQKSEAAAQIVAEILTRQSITMAISDKATAIQTMLKISKLYPQLSLPIQLKPVVETRH